MRIGSRSVGRGTALVATLVLLTGCGEDPPADDEAAEADPADGEASVVVASPADGEEVEQPFELEFDVDGVELGEVEEGLHHLHIYIGDDYDMHFADDPFTVDGVEEGEHTFRVVLAQANHDELDVEDEVAVAVTGAPAADDEEAEGEDEDEDDGYGY